MLYDPKWEKPEVKADPMAIEPFIAWLEQQPADSTYCYVDRGLCLIARYLSSLGFRKVDVGAGGSYRHEAGSGHAPRFMHIAAIGFGADRDWTFGAALRRARHYLPR